MNIIVPAVGLENLTNWHYTALVLFLLPWCGMIVLLIYCRNLQQRRRCQQALLQQLYDRCDELEKLQQSLSALAKVSYFVMDADNHVIAARRGNNAYDLKLPEYYQAHMQPEDREMLKKNCQQLFSGERTSFQMSCTLHFNGKRKRHLNYAQIITTRHLQRKRFLLLAMDISEFEQQTGELARTGSILSAIFDNLPGHIFLKNNSSDFAYLRCNSTYSKLLNRSPEELIGKSDFDLFDRDLAVKIRACDLGVTTTQSVADNRWFFTTPDGQEHAIRFISRVLKLSDGFECILGFGVDVTRQEYIASKLRRRNKELRILLAHFSEKIMLINDKLQFVCASPSAINRLSIDTTAAEQLNCPNIFRCGITDCTCCAASRALTSQTPAVCNLPGNGCRLNIQPVMDNEKNTLYLAVTIDLNDDTESLKSEI